MTKSHDSSRRLLLKASAVFCGIKLTVAGASAFALQIADENQAADQVEADKDGENAETKPFKDQGRRLYFISPDDNATFTREVLPKIEPRPFALQPAPGSRGRGIHLQIQEMEAAPLEAADELPAADQKVPQAGAARIARPAANPQPPAVIWAIWVKPEAAKEIAEIPGVESVTEKKPKDIIEVGDAEDANGSLSVMFVPTPWNGMNSDQPHASLEQILASLRDESSMFDEVTFKTVEKKQLEPHAAIGNIPMEQIIVEFSTPELNETVLEIIKNHPQTMYLKWDGMFTQFVCPGCGMG